MPVLSLEKSICSNEGEQVGENADFIPSRNLPNLSSRIKVGKHVEDLSSSIKVGLNSIALALGVAKGQSEQIVVDVKTVGQSNLMDFSETEDSEEEEGDDYLDEFETQFTTRWLLNVNSLSWLNPDSFQDDEELIESILSESSRLIAILSGQSASSGIRQVYHFNSSNLQVSARICNTAIIEDSLGGRTWNSAPLLANHVLELLRENFSEEQTSFLELGAGTGLTGLTVALGLQNFGSSTAKIHLTDFHENVLKNLKANVNLNGLTDVQVFPFDWSDCLNKDFVAQQMYDCLLCADCIYEPQHAQLIHAVANKLLSKNNVIKKEKELNAKRIKGKLFLLSPLRHNHTKELNALYQAFPHLQSHLLSSDNGQLSLRITHQKEFVMPSRDDFGPPRLRSHPTPRVGPISTLKAYHVNNIDQTRSYSGLIYRLHTIEWCNTIDR